MIGKNLRKKNVTIALNVLYDKKYILLMFQNKKQVIILIIPNGEKWHYPAVRKLLALLRRITSKNYCDFYCLNCLHSYRTKNKLESHKKVCEKNFCNVIMLFEDTKVLEFNQYQSI